MTGPTTNEILLELEIAERGLREQERHEEADRVARQHTAVYFEAIARGEKGLIPRGGKE